jgi:hypothetical protein
MGGLEGEDERSAIPSSPRIITHSTTGLRASTNDMRVFGGILIGTSLRDHATVQQRYNRRIRTGDLELRQRMYRDTLYDIWLSFAFFLLRRVFPTWEADDGLAPYRAVVLFSLSFLSWAYLPGLVV